MRMTPSLPLVILTAVLATACGGGNDTSSTKDTTPPAAVTDVVAIIGDGSVTLRWENPTSDFAYTQIRRATSGPVTADTGDVVYEGGDVNTITDSGLANGTTYYYGFVAYDAAGNAAEVTPLVAHLPTPEVVTFADANLEAAIRAALSKPTGDLMTTDLLALTFLAAPYAGIADLGGLEHCVNLETLGLQGNDLDYGDVETLATLTNLLSLSVGANALTTMPALSLPHLTSLDVSSNALTTMPVLTGLPHLTSLEVSFNSALDSVEALGAVTTLRSLDISGTAITDLAPLASATGLTSLVLLFTAVDDLTPLTNLTALEILNVNDTAVDDLAPLAGLTALRHLMASGNGVTDLSPLAGLTELASLNVADNSIHDLQALVDNPGLTLGDNVNLQNNPLLHDAVATQIPTLLARGVDVVNSSGMPTETVGVWSIASVTENATPTDLATYFGWSASTASNRLWIYFNDTYRAEELDAGGAVLTYEEGTIGASGSDLTITMTSQDGVEVLPSETTFQGTYAMSGTDLVLTETNGPDTTVLTWSPLP